MLPLLATALCQMAAEVLSTTVLDPSTQGRTTWDPVTQPCPCSSAALCRPVNGTTFEHRDGTLSIEQQGVYVMHDGFTAPHPGAPDDTYIWSRYDWEQVTTIAVFGVLSAELYCHAHAHGVRVTFGYNRAPWETNFTHVWQNASLVEAYAQEHAAFTLSTRTDGWSLDMEVRPSP